MLYGIIVVRNSFEGWGGGAGGGKLSVFTTPKCDIEKESERKGERKIGRDKERERVGESEKENV